MMCIPTSTSLTDGRAPKPFRACSRAHGQIARRPGAFATGPNAESILRLLSQEVR